MDHAPSERVRLQIRKDGTRKSRTQPYSVEVLIIMCLICVGRASTDIEILEWIHTEFYFLLRLAFQTPRHVGSETAWDEAYSAIEFQQQLSVALYLEELALERFAGADGKTCFRVWETDGLSYLENVAVLKDNVTRGTFPFFKLPAEIRNVIYEMVFEYSGAVLRIEHSATGLSEDGRAMIRNGEGGAEDARHSDLDYNEPADVQTQYTRPFSEILAPLLINRQFYCEAMPTFLRLNTFVFKNADGMADWLDCIGPKRREHIVALGFKLTDPLSGPEAPSKKLRQGVAHSTHETAAFGKTGDQNRRERLA
jgi:hypothetical protein